MMACLNVPVLIGGRLGRHIVPLRIVQLTPGVIEDEFGTAANPRRASANDRRFVSTNDDRGHAGRAA